MYFYDTKFRFSQPQLFAMFELQSTANDVMSDAWRTSCNCTIQYYRASLMEGAETLDHMGWKWWKKTTPNVAQAFIELIDILHFTLSHYVRESFVAFQADGIEGDNEVVFDHAADMVASMDPTVAILPVGRNFSEDAYEKIELGEDGLVDIEKYDFNDLMELFMYTCLAEGRPDMNLLYALFDKVGASPEEVFKTYVAKNFLNQFRTRHGQRTNEYFKIWDGREDNVWVEDYMNQLEVNDQPLEVEALATYLETTYHQQLAANTVEKA